MSDSISQLLGSGGQGASIDEQGNMALGMTPNAPGGYWRKEGNVYVRTQRSNGKTTYYPANLVHQGKFVEFEERNDAEKANDMDEKQLQGFLAKLGKTQGAEPDLLSTNNNAATLPPPGTPESDSFIRQMLGMGADAKITQAEREQFYGNPKKKKYHYGPQIAGKSKDMLGG